MADAGKSDLPTVVFVHGFLGCGRLPLIDVAFFRGADALMAGVGAPYLMPSLPRGGNVETRAAALARILDKSDARRLVLIGHSMGGLDSRLVAARMDPGRRVKAVVTLGTPHRGSPLADHALAGKDALAVYARWRGWRPALADLSLVGAARFNDAVRDRPDVHYLSYAGARPEAETPLWARRFQRLIADRDGDNDGQVSVESARWGEFRGVARADHWELIGWNLAFARAEVARPFPHLQLLKAAVDDGLAAAG
ncbi:MAG: alpha/beta fold hydrolase [Rhodospirillales bacterium]|nr:alpha/beta fold hydrolase [Rhodospirillales bacterium]